MTDLVIIGGGPAGMSAAVSAYEKGIRDIIILERDSSLGGILNQCIHNGFGLHKFGEELTGPEYAWKYEKRIKELGIAYKTNTMVLDITEDKVVTATNAEDGIFMIQAKAIILAMGYRERAKGALNISGTRPAGIYSAGTAQKLVNSEGYMPGKNVVILGSGDIGLIMARRMTLEGANVVLDRITKGAVVDQDRQTTIDGIFTAGNVLHVHDLVDFVSEEAEIAGKSAAQYIKGISEERINVEIKTDGKIIYTVPQIITKNKDITVGIF